MASRYAKHTFRFMFMAVAALLIVPSQSFAQGGGNNGGGIGGNNGLGTGGNNFFGVVGGVSVDAQKVVRGEFRSLDKDDQARIRQALGQANADINESSLRMISLKGLDAAIAANLDSGEPLPAEIQYMAGLQRIEYVISVPEQNDIILAGPGEGWTTNEEGNVVGKKSGMPVIHLQDFLVAMRAVDNARQGQGVSVSIDPTPEGVQRVERLFSQIYEQRIQGITPALAAKIEEAYGDQQVSLTGVPRDSHFSRVMLTADYKMKRIAMGLDQSPLRKLPSMLSIIAKKNIRLNKAAPRMWMECDYEPVAKNSDNNIWKLSGTGVRVQTEDTIVEANGDKRASGKKIKVAEDWANNMTKQYEALSAKEPIFRDLRNVMDMSVVAAIIRNEDLLNVSGAKLPMITEELDTPSYTIPESIPSKVSFVGTSSNTALQVSGGVLLNSWAVAQNTIVSEKLANVATIASTPTADRWWWNAKK